MLREASAKEGGAKLYCAFPAKPCTCVLRASNDAQGGSDVSQDERGRGRGAANELLGEGEAEGGCLFDTMALLLGDRTPVDGWGGIEATAEAGVGGASKAAEGAQRLQRLVTDELRRNPSRYTLALGLTVEEVLQHVEGNSPPGRYELEVRPPARPPARPLARSLARSHARTHARKRAGAALVARVSERWSRGACGPADDRNVLCLCTCVCKE